MSIKQKFASVFRSLLVVVFAASLGSAYAQLTVSGSVTSSEDGSGLIGATVLVKGTTTGVITGDDGSFEVTVPSGESVLVFSYIGYERQEIPVNGRTNIDVTLQATQAVLDEVVVTGYGTQKTREVTASISSIKAEDFNVGNVNDPTQLIQGKVAGLSIVRPGSDPNGGFTLRLRGLSSIGANAQPLIIIDGVIGANLQTVDPNDIQSIDVLKDASAAAIYGTRGTSGVILITTKRGIPGTATMNYNGYGTVENVSRTLPMASAQEFVELGGGTDLGSSTDWIDEVTRTGLSQVHNFSLAGGSGLTSYRVSFNYRDIQGVGIVSGFNQLNGRANLTQKAINDRLTLTVDLSNTVRNSEFGFNEAYRYGIFYNPTAPVFITDESDPLFSKYGGYYQQENFDYFNPFSIADQNLNEGSLKRLIVSGRAKFELVDGIDIQAFVSQQRESELYGQYYAKTSYFRGFNRNGYAERFTEDRINNLFETTLNIDRQFGNIGLDGVVGYSIQDFDKQNVFVNAGDFLSDIQGYNNLGFAQDLKQVDNIGLASVGSFREASRLIRFFGRFNFNIDDTYYLSITAAQEGSSTFGENNKWGLFPGISAGVTLSNLFDVSFINNLKLRASLGRNGNLPPGPYLSQFLFTERGSFFYNGAFVPAYGPDRNNNPNLRWETKDELTVGVDFSLFDFRLNGSIEYYSRVTRDFIFPVNVPVPPNQAGTTFGNLEDVVLRNAGFEAQIGYNLKAGNFSWEPNFVFSTFNTVLDTIEVDEDAEFRFFREGQGEFFEFSTSPGAPGLNNDPSVVVRAGEELGQFFGFQVDKDDPVTEDGQFKFIDQDGNGVIDADDEIAFGNALPDFSIGFNNSFKFGRVDLNFFIRGDFGHQLANMYRVFYEPLGGRPNDNLVKSKYFRDDLTAAPIFSSYYVEDADYIALDNASLGYTFDLRESKAFRSLRVYVAGQNLFFITGYTGIDPTPRYADPGASDNGGQPANQFNPNPLAPGIERRNVYFLTRSFTVGLNLGL